jgi:uncharacterized membrane protein
MQSKRFVAKYSLVIFLMILLIIGIFIRIWDLGQLNLWRDESFTVLLAEKSLKEIIKISIADFNSPFYPVILHFWIRIFVNSEFSVRFPSVIFSALNLFYFYFIARKYFSKVDALLVLSIFIFNLVSIFYARECRPYALLNLLISMSFYHYSNLLPKINLKDAIFFLTASTLALYTHNTALIFILAEIIFLTLFVYLKNKKQHIDRTLISKWGVILFLLLSLIIPWILVLIKQTPRLVEEFWLNFHPIYSIRDALFDMANGIRLFSSFDFNLYQKMNSILIIILLIIGIFPKWKYLDEKVNIIKFFFLFPLILIYIMSFKIHLMYIRYISFLEPLFFLLVYRGMINIRSKFKSKTFTLIYAIMFYFQLTIICYYYKKDSKPHYRELVQFLESVKMEDSIILHYDAVSYFSTEYYMKNTDLESQILDPDYTTKTYVGKALLKEEDFLRDLTYFEKFDKLWVIDLKDVSEKQRIPEEFELREENLFSGKLALQLWQKDEKTSNSHSNL